MFDVKNFYDDLAPEYHLMFEDWPSSVRKQGEVLNQFVKKNLGRKPNRILDCACGIGTQSIGLALQGYNIFATDITPSALERAKIEAQNFGVSVSTKVADFRHLEDSIEGEFELVICCDNAISHMSTDKDLDLATKSIFSKVKKGGHFLATIRDYDFLLKQGANTTLPALSESLGERRVSFQIWKWAQDLKTYDLELFLFHERKGQWEVKSRKGMFRALKREELDASLTSAGFREIKWHFPDTSGFYQPIVTAQK